MKSLKKAIAIFTATVCMSMPLHANAMELDVQPEMTAMSSAVGDTASPLAEGLIASHSVQCKAGVNMVYITASVTGFNKMAKIGFQDIEVQRSVNGIDGWTTVATPNDQIAGNAYSHSFTNFAVSVAGNAYYRVSLKFYAKELGWFFPSTQTKSDTSNVVWVPLI